MKKHNILVVLLLVFMQSCMDEPVMHPNTSKGNFEALWKIIDTKYCYLDYKNINWDSVHLAYNIKVNDSIVGDAFFYQMQDMLAELKDGHVNLSSSFDRSRYWNWYTDFPANFSSSLIYNNRYLGKNYRIAGGLLYNKISNDSIGYIYYGSFSSDFSDTNFRYIMTYFQHCKGLIIDVRNNGGGSLENSKKLAAYFFQNDTVTGYIRHKTGDGHSDFSEPLEIITKANKTLQWQRPVVVLSNRLSYSATNDFINRMKHAPHAVIVGDKSGGGGGMPFSSELPNGWSIRFSASPMFDSKMQHTEWGIEPDVKDSIKVADQADGIDSIIERAVSLLK